MQNRPTDCCRRNTGHKLLSTLKAPCMEKITPKASEPHSKVVNGKTFSWCRHKAWCIHKPSECCLGMPVTNGAAQSSDGAQDSASTVLAKALAVL